MNMNVNNILNMNDNWIEIVETLQPCINGNFTELKYQQEIENCLKYLGWRSSNRTMQSQVTINIGNNNFIRPDIVLYKNNQPVLPIEIKRPNNVCNIRQESQLVSYMRQLRLNVGLFIGENIQLYYDCPDFDRPISILKVELCAEDAYGDFVCEMFSYEKFDIENLEHYCKERYNQIIAHNNFQLRLDEFLSDKNASNNIVALIREKFAKEGFDASVMDGELEKYEFKVIYEHPQSKSIAVEGGGEINDITIANKEHLEFSVDGIHYYGVGRFVLAVINKYISEHPNITYDELERVFPPELGRSKKNGVVRTIEFIKENPKKQIRFFSGEPIKLIDNTFIVVCSQWGNSGTSKIYFQNFLEHVKTMYHVYTRSKLK